jgi:hypothetical protein
MSAKGGKRTLVPYDRVMPNAPKIELSRLREIGWSEWDPIGVGGPDHSWPADEYDSYLLHAAGQLWQNQTEEAVADYLLKVETEHMGLDAVPGLHARALEVAKAIREYVETLRG